MIITDSIVIILIDQLSPEEHEAFFNALPTLSTCARKIFLVRAVTQQAIPGKSNEITAIPELAKVLEIEGDVLTHRALEAFSSWARSLQSKLGALLDVDQPLQPVDKNNIVHICIEKDGSLSVKDQAGRVYLVPNLIVGGQLAQNVKQIATEDGCFFSGGHRGAFIFVEPSNPKYTLILNKLSMLAAKYSGSLHKTNNMLGVYPPFCKSLTAVVSHIAAFEDAEEKVRKVADNAQAKPQDLAPNSILVRNSPGELDQWVTEKGGVIMDPKPFIATLTKSTLEQEDRRFEFSGAS